MADAEHKPLKRLVGPPPPKSALPEGAAAAVDVVKKKLAPPKGVPPVMGDFKVPKHLSPDKKPSRGRGDKHAAGEDDDDDRSRFGKKSYADDAEASQAYGSIRNKSSILRKSKYDDDEEEEEDSYRPSRNYLNNKYDDAIESSSDNANSKSGRSSYNYREDEGDSYVDDGGRGDVNNDERNNGNDEYTDENYQEDYNRDDTRRKGGGDAAATTVEEEDEAVVNSPPSVFRGVTASKEGDSRGLLKEQPANVKLQAFTFHPILKATYKVLKSFATSPCPPGQIIKCYIERNRTGKNYFSPFYSLCADLEVGASNPNFPSFLSSC